MGGDPSLLLFLLLISKLSSKNMLEVYLLVKRRQCFVLLRVTKDKWAS
jgi:hypothetical protein